MNAKSQAIELIPLNQLVVSSLNVRRRDRKVDVDALAASIAAHGLLQNLSVAPSGEGKFEVVAGGRRLAALKALAKSGAIARDYCVPCRVIEAEQGREASLAENIQRVGMDAMDEVDAYAALVAEGSKPEQVAQRFGVTLRHVEQRLALASLSPKIKAAWKRGDVTLDAARAFCIEADHGRQEAVFRSLGKPVTHPASVRARLMDGRVRSTDRFVRFVGLEAYENAGGRVIRDLFDADAVFVSDPGLVAQLAEAKLRHMSAQWAEAGWGWVDVSLENARGTELSPQRLQPTWRDPSEDEQKELDRLQSEIEALDAALETDSTDDDARWSQRDDLEAAFETIRQQARDWDPTLKAHAGVMLSVDHDGDCVVTEGLVRKQDQKTIDGIRRKAVSPGSDSDTDAESASSHDEKATGAGRLPKAVARDLTLERTRALRQHLASDPDVALALTVASMTARQRAGCELAGVAVAANSARIEDAGDIEAARAALDDRLPQDGEALLRACLQMNRETLLGLLAVLVSAAVDLAHEDTSSTDRARQAVADALASALDIDMAQHWRPDLAFWLRLPKTLLVEALGASPAVAGLSMGGQMEFLTAAAKLKKDALAGKVEHAWSGRGYLPDLLVTPIASGALELTLTGAETVAAE